MPESLFFFFNNFIYLFIIFGCIGSLLLHRFFSSCGERGLLSSRGAQASQRGGFPRCGAQALEHWLSSRGTRAQLLLGMWDPPGPGIEPKSPAMAGRFPSTEPPGKP